MAGLTYNQYTPAPAGSGKLFLHARTSMVRTCRTRGHYFAEQPSRLGKGSRSDVRGVQNVEPRTSNFASRALIVGKGLPRNMISQHRREGSRPGPTRNSLDVPTRADR